VGTWELGSQTLNSAQRWDRVVHLAANGYAILTFSKANGVKPVLFSSNSEGACPACNGAGVIHTELGVMATVESVCEECEGKRLQASVLEYTFAGRTSPTYSRCR